MEENLEKYRPLFIGGEWVDPAQGETDDDINPATGKTIAKVAVAGRDDIERAVNAAPEGLRRGLVRHPAERTQHHAPQARRRHRYRCK